MAKAQASIEFLVIVAFFLVFLTPIVFIMLDLSGEKSDETALSQAHQLGRRLADLADGVYIQGGESTRVENLFFPPKISCITFDSLSPSGGELTISLDTVNGPTDIVFLTTAPLSSGTTDWCSTDGTPSIYLGAGMKPVKVSNDAAMAAVAIDYAGEYAG